MSVLPWTVRWRTHAAPLVDAAERFALRFDPSAGRDLEAGVVGIRHLARVIDRFVYSEQSSDEEERAFIEGAGAMLGLLLLEHVGHGGFEKRDGVARVRLGGRGFFDPFAAIDRILDAEQPRKALSDEITLAELEATDRGPLSRVVAAFDRALTESSEQRIVSQFDSIVALDRGIEVDLRRVVDATRGEPSATVDLAVRKLLALIEGREGDATLDELERRLVPRLVGATFLDTLRERAADQQIFVAPFIGELRIALLLAYEGRSRFVRTHELTTLGWSAEQAISTACTNLVTRARAPRLEALGPFVPEGIRVRTGDGLDGARLLDPRTRAALESRLGPSFLLAIPHRDALLAAPCGAARALDAFAREEFLRAPHRVAAGLFRASPDGLSIARPADREAHVDPERR